MSDQPADIRDVDKEQFAIDLLTRSKTHEEWLAIVRFGMPTLLRESLFLMELITMQAMRLHDEKLRPTFKLPDYTRYIMWELGLFFKS